jgi:secreted PhoX family phosphatase
MGLAGGVAALGLGAAFWREMLAEDAGGAPSLPHGPGYGPLGKPDEHGIRLPEGFSARVVARGKEKVPGTSYRWHVASDGAATFATGGGGWILASNSEDEDGGVSAIRFDRDGRIEDAYRILDGTTANCSGGATPWGTWLSCEEVEGGHVWECDPTGRRRAVMHPAMGAFKHEAAAVDPHERRVYLTEDLIDGGFYRFTPRRWPSFDSGLLEVAIVGAGGAVSWTEVPDPAGRRRRTRYQIHDMTHFRRAEGIWYDSGTVYIATTADSQIHAYDTRRRRVETIYDGLARKNPPLILVDQMTLSPGGELFVCEDSGSPEQHIGVLEPSHAVRRFLSISGPEHAGSELTGVAFTPGGRHLYFSSQRARENGAIYKVSGPFRRARS